MMNPKKAYNSFAKQNDLSLFFQEWYLDLLYGKDKWTCAFYEDEHQILAIWIYAISRVGPISYVALPTLIKYTGLCFADHVKDSEYGKIQDDLIKQLPKTASWIQQISVEVSPFFNDSLHGIVKQSRGTYLLNIDVSSEVILQGMDGNYRRAINKFLPDLKDNHDTPAGSSDVLNFISLLEDSMGGLANHAINSNILEKLILESEKRGQGKLLLLYKDESLVSSAFCVWDEEKAYYLLAGNNSEFKKIYPGVLMAYSFANYLRTKKIGTLDFLGSDIESISRIWRKLGAEKRSYDLIKKEKHWFRILKKLLGK